MEYGLVSIVVPCFNGEKYLDIFFQSIISQNYPQVELILVDDGSTDNTKIKCDSWFIKFKKANIDFRYVYKKNGGAASAINIGLKLVRGEFFIWPDCDDELMPESINKRVEFLRRNITFNIVRSQALICDEKTPEKFKLIGGGKKHQKNDIFKDLVFQTTFVTCGCYMVRTTSLFKTFPERTILESKVGQNWQILLPLTLNNEVGFIGEPLYKYFVRDSSHSHKILGNYYEAVIEREKNRNEFLIKILGLLNQKNIIVKIKIINNWKFFKFSMRHFIWVEAFRYFIKLLLKK